MTSFIEHSQNNQVRDEHTRGETEILQVRVGATIKGQQHGGLCDDGGHVYLIAVVVT